MKLSAYAKLQGVSYRTALRWFQAGTLPGVQLPTGTILVDDPRETPVVRDNPTRVAIYSRVSSSENKTNAASQASRLQAWSAAQGYQVTKVVVEVGSGLNSARPKLLALMSQTDWDMLVVEHKDRLTRFGFEYLAGWAAATGRKVVVVNEVEDPQERLVEDFVSVITSMCQRIYGSRRGKRKTEVLTAQLTCTDE